MCLPSVANSSAYFRVPASVFSVKFRAIPWQMLLLSCPTVAHASGSERQLLSIIFVNKTRVGSCKFNCHSPLLQKSIMLGLAND
jgi:hypothetical protein